MSNRVKIRNQPRTSQHKGHLMKWMPRPTADGGTEVVELHAPDCPCWDAGDPNKALQAYRDSRPHNPFRRIGRG